MNRRKYVSPLTPPARERLLDHEGDGGKARRHRLKAQAIRLSAKGLAIGETASVCEQGRGTISRWIDRWESQGFAFFTERPRGGRPPKLKPEQAAAVLGRAGEEPRSKRRLCERVEREFRIRVSPGPIGRLPKKRLALQAPEKEPPRPSRPAGIQGGPGPPANP